MSKVNKTKQNRIFNWAIWSLFSLWKNAFLRVHNRAAITFLKLMIIWPVVCGWMFVCLCVRACRWVYKCIFYILSSIYFLILLKKLLEIFFLLFTLHLQFEKKFKIGKYIIRNAFSWNDVNDATNTFSYRMRALFCTHTLMIINGRKNGVHTTRYFGINNCFYSYFGWMWVSID